MGGGVLVEVEERDAAPGQGEGGGSGKGSVDRSEHESRIGAPAEKPLMNRQAAPKSRAGSISA